MKVVYLAGPYRHPEFGGRTLNILRAWKYCKDFWFYGEGKVVPLCPHLNSLFMCEDVKGNDVAAEHKKKVEGLFLEGDLTLIARCDFLYLLPGWQKSSGTLDEIKFANKMKLPTVNSDQVSVKGLCEALVDYDLFDALKRLEAGSELTGL